MNDREKCNFFRQSLLEAAGIYSDYSQYENVMYELDENFDQSVERYHFHSWMGEDCSTIVSKTAAILGAGIQLFNELSELAERGLYSTFIEISNQSDTIQKEVLGLVLPKEGLGKEEFRDMLELMEAKYVQEEALEEFLRVLHEKMGEKE